MLEFNDQKPLRQEDYQALAEENRQLREKLAKPAKPPRKPWGLRRRAGQFFFSLWKEAEILEWSPKILVGLLILGLFSGLGLLLRDCDRQQKAHPACYKVARRGGDVPWAPWHLWVVRDTRYEHGEWPNRECDLDDLGKQVGACPGWKDPAEGYEFIRKWNLRACQ